MKLITGVITATKMNKTATVSVTRFVTHPLYQKRLRRTKKYQVHDEVGHQVGEQVNFVACAPISKTKKWKIVESAPVARKVETKIAEVKVAAPKKAATKPKAEKKAVAKKK